MANDVFANGMEIACKKASGKSICAFPDVVWTPPDKVPPTPTGVPVPYPNTAMASDTSKGSKKVKVSGKEVMLKNSSNFKKSMGDEAGVAQLKGFVTMKNRGKIFFQMYSMDVKFEGKNVVRHFDLCTHNHGSMVGNTPPWMYVDTVAFDAQNTDEDCKENFKKARDECTDSSGQSLVPDNCTDDCKKAQACVLVAKKNDKKQCCKPGNTGHHVVPAHCCKGLGSYNENNAPCVCAAGWSWHRNDRSGIDDDEKTHPALHEHQDVMERRVIEQFPIKKKMNPSTTCTQKRPWLFRQARAVGTAAHKKVFKDSSCNHKCLNKQLDDHHESVGIDGDTPIKAKKYGNKDRAQSGNTVEKIKNKKKALGL